MSDSLTVAVGGHIDLDQKCESCGAPMIFYCPDGTSEHAFCGNFNAQYGHCVAVFKAVPVLTPRVQDQSKEQE